MVYDQNSVSLLIVLYIIFEIHHSGQEPLNCILIDQGLFFWLCMSLFSSHISTLQEQCNLVYLTFCSVFDIGSCKSNVLQYNSIFFTYTSFEQLFF